MIRQRFITSKSPFDSCTEESKREPTSSASCFRPQALIRVISNTEEPGRRACERRCVERFLFPGNMIKGLLGLVFQRLLSVCNHIAIVL